MKRAGTLDTSGQKIRGLWASTPTRRQSGTDVGSAFDGSQGVDSQDILGIPEIGFSTFQFFPDQDTYGNDDPSVPAYNSTVQSGVDWIKKQAQAAAQYVVPRTLQLGSHSLSCVQRYDKPTVAIGKNH